MLRKLVIRGLPHLEREILGEQFVGGIKPNGNGAPVAAAESEVKVAE